MAHHVDSPPPLPPGSFVGRERELDQVRGLLTRSRLVTLTGPGGVGKTRLALEVAAQWQQRTSSSASVAFVALAPVIQPELVISAIAQALGVSEIERRALLQTLEDVLRDRELLLVLDNFEQVIQAATALASMLATCTRLKLLVTSRVVLRIASEQVFAVPPLDLPDDDRQRSVDEIGRVEAVRLFVDRARAARADFELTDESAAAVANICRRLDGLPLAIVLAAAHVRLLPPLALLARLERRLPLLGRGHRDNAARHQTLSAAIAWSYDLLEESEQRLFRALAVFAGGCTLEAAEAVAGEPSGSSGAVLDSVAGLIDASLVRQVDLHGQPRLLMLETIRDFGQEQLQASGEEPLVRRRHCDWCLALAEQDPMWMWPRQRLNLLDDESANLYAAIRWASEQAEAQIGLRLTAGLWPLWLVRGRYAEGRACLAELLALPTADAATSARARALYCAGYLAYRQVDFERAGRLADEALMVARHAGSAVDLARTLLLLGNLARERGDFQRAHAFYDQAEAAGSQVQRFPWRPFTLIQRSLTFFEQADLEQAERAATEAERLFREIDNPPGIALSLLTLGRIAASRRDFGGAVALIEGALVLQREVEDSNGVQWSLRHLGFCELDRGNPAQARHWFIEALAHARDTGDRVAQARCLAGLSAVLAATDPTRAVRLAASAQRIWEQIGATPNPSEVERLDAWLTAARDVLGSTRFAETWTEGLRLPISDILDVGLRPEPEQPPGGRNAPHRRSPADPLTPRERDVVRLLARGAAAREIAVTLVISDGTVRSHIEHILTKLQLHSRVQLASWAVQHGYLEP